MDAYEITIAPAAAPALRRLAPADLAAILLHLEDIAAAAPRPREPLAPRLHHGLHRAALGPVWITFRISHEHHRVTLVGLGARDVHAESPGETRWSNEGGQ